MSPTTPATKYRDYFFLDGDITIRVENSVFKIDKHFLTRESRILKSLLNPIVPSRDPPGSSEANPFVLDDATSEGFASLLWVFYNLEFSFENTPVDKWKDILFLARQWGITRIEKLCIRELGKIYIPPVDKIELYQKFGLSPNLLHASFVELVMQPKLFSIEEGERLTLPTSMRLAEARERARDPDAPITLEESDVRTIVEEVFGLQGSTPPSAATSPLKEKENTTTDDQVDKGLKSKPPRNKNRASRTTTSFDDFFSR